MCLGNTLDWLQSCRNLMWDLIFPILSLDLKLLKIIGTLLETLSLLASDFRFLRYSAGTRSISLIRWCLCLDNKLSDSSVLLMMFTQLPSSTLGGSKQGSSGFLGVKRGMHLTICGVHFLENPLGLGVGRMCPLSQPDAIILDEPAVTSLHLVRDLRDFNIPLPKSTSPQEGAGVPRLEPLD